LTVGLDSGCALVPSGITHQAHRMMNHVRMNHPFFKASKARVMASLSMELSLE
jgi:hypothetical protein